MEYNSELLHLFRDKKKNKTLKWDKCFDTGNGTRNYHGTLDAWHVTKPFGGALFGDLWGQLVGDWAQSKKWPISGAYLTVLPSISIKCHLQAHDYAQEPGIQRRVSDLETKRSVPSVGQICVYIYHISIQVCVCVCVYYIYIIHTHTSICSYIQCIYTCYLNYIHIHIHLHLHIHIHIHIHIQCI